MSCFSTYFKVNFPRTLAWKTESRCSTVSASIMWEYAIQKEALIYCLLNYPNNFKILINYKTHISYM